MLIFGLLDRNLGFPSNLLPKRGLSDLVTSVDHTFQKDLQRYPGFGGLGRYLETMRRHIQRDLCYTSVMPFLCSDISTQQTCVKHQSHCAVLDEEPRSECIQ